MNLKGKLFLLPMPISENTENAILPIVVNYWNNIKIYFVEEIKSVRRVMKSMDKSIDIDSMTFYLLNEHEEADFKSFEEHINNGENIALMSDAGCAVVADPGKTLVNYAHTHNIDVVPIVGPNSMLLALMASGLQGQRFSFKGYLPKENNERMKAIKNFENQSFQNDESIIFMDTPYRNQQVYDSIIKTCSNQTRLCIAANITSKKELIKTKTIEIWKKQNIILEKVPTVFLIKKD